MMLTSPSSAGRAAAMAPLTARRETAEKMAVLKNILKDLLGSCLKLGRKFGKKCWIVVVVIVRV